MELTSKSRDMKKKQNKVRSFEKKSKILIPKIEKKALQNPDLQMMTDRRDRSEEFLILNQEAKSGSINTGQFKMHAEPDH